METEWHFVMECTAYEDIRNKFKANLQVNNMKELFEEARLYKTANLLIQLHNKRNNLEKIQLAA